MNRLLADARLALRTWRKTPGFTAVAIVSIALGIGANAAIFTLVDQVLLRALPVQDPHELVQLTFQGSRYGSNWGDGSELSYPVYIAATGIALALPAAWWLVRYVSTQLYGVEPTDPITFIGATALLTAVAALAGLIPSGRAARLDPTTALRAE